jgi:hypothetical protein
VKRKEFNALSYRSVMGVVLSKLHLFKFKECYRGRLDVQQDEYVSKNTLHLLMLILIMSNGRTDNIIENATAIRITKTRRKKLVSESA